MKVKDIQDNFTIKELLIKLFFHLNKRRKIELLLHLFLMIINSLAEVISLAAIIPFLSVLANPENILKYRIIKMLSYSLNINSPSELRLPLTILFGLLVLLAGLIRLINLWLTFKIGGLVGNDLKTKVFKNILYQPYLNHITSHSSASISTMTQEVTTVVYRVIIPQLQLISSAIISICLITTLLIINWKIAFIAGSIMTFFYFSTIKLSKNTVKILSNQEVFLNKNLIKLIQEGLGSIREVILNNNHLYFFKNFERISFQLESVRAKSSFLSTYPRLALEPIGITSLSLIAFFSVSQNGLENAFPLIGSLALGIQKLLPLTQKIYEGLIRTKGAKASLITVINFLDKPIVNEDFVISQTNLLEINSIKFKDVYFNYPNMDRKILNSINFSINQGEKIAIIGKTGSGKSTLVDLLIGLLVPSKGEIIINGNNINNPSNNRYLAKWRSSIAHIPQNIYLADSSIKENIAFGIPLNKIDEQRINDVINKSQLRDFIDSCKNGVNSLVGENGVALSGGQRQRIGIARALYKNKNFLLLDEATSALDVKTEESIMKNICSNNSKITLIIITHRNNNLKYCERIIKINEGSIKEYKNIK